MSANRIAFSGQNQGRELTPHETAARKEAEKQAVVERRMQQILKFAAGLSPVGGRYHGITSGVLSCDQAVRMGGRR